MRAFCIGIGLIALLGCGHEQGAAEFVVRVGQERFVVRIMSPDQIETARQILAGRLSQRIISGELRAGDGGFNRDPQTGRRWSWHLDPQTVVFAEVAIELCDGLPSHVEANLPYWLGTVRRFCPWSAFVEREL
ncbi:MAG: hypothetical protein N2561_07235 [Bacteroidetes bacterium]|nr:hypothetical protein [Rhodothermia bacterium]MCS7155029.1 hypothetical protein [Bacteroidota bacterium]MCX7907313.1 hypothetical protein [Bacteroidota bacterium]MDW8137960.1 hypothetical protein [Bacteroidota bacterium]MDW8286188.1 hypothetical protein [Bacteroidota bacterium]